MHSQKTTDLTIFKKNPVCFQTVRFHFQFIFAIRPLVNSRKKIIPHMKSMMKGKIELIIEERFGLD